MTIAILSCIGHMISVLSYDMSQCPDPREFISAVGTYDVGVAHMTSMYVCIHVYICVGVVCVQQY